MEKTKDGASISLKLQDGRGSIVRVYVGAAPGSALFEVNPLWRAVKRQARPTAMATLHAWVHDKYAARRPGGTGPVNLSQSWWGVLRSHQFPLADKSAGCA